ncbi:MAG TPA: bifunctional methylenetetrahydrofolate dehydrogenase/methenyltetrahydrofolate cyclohydrolase, partial [Candidatus Competibacteraceae bacterium]|nr:bifunctional methylenetetrahydrofolate dehydrogenase/methenyltetrahydrofolate cyclohydrolase [Candidatus Competibacteraceae bacterium]
MATATIIDGKDFAARLRAAIAVQVADLKKAHHLTPGLAVVLVGDDLASQVYVRNKGIQAQEAGMNSFDHRLPTTVTAAELLEKINQLNQDPAVHGILVQLP